MLSEFQNEFEKWAPEEAPTDRFKYLLGRLYEEKYFTAREGLLSQARIRDRAFEFVKKENGCTFCIVRHPGGFTEDVIGNRITQTWDVDFPSRTFAISEVRDFQKGDIDP